MTTIGNGVFAYNQLTSVVIPNNITSLGVQAFAHNQLATVTLSNSMTSIASVSFAYNKLTSIIIPSSVTTIENSAFVYNKLASLNIPSSVTTISTGAFRANDLTSLSIPNTVTSLGVYAFESNQLTSLTLGCGVASLTSELFAINKLKDVSIPDCVTSIDPATFFGQNPWGGIIDTEDDPAHDWWSTDPSVLQTIYNNIWYTALHTSNPTNPNLLHDGAVDETWYGLGDINNNGNETDSIGGHIVNPAVVSVKYVDATNKTISADSTYTGQFGDGTLLTNYLVKNIPMPAFADASTPTPEEQAAFEASLAPYYQIGESALIEAPVISGYTLESPSSPRTVSLTGANTIANFVYAAVPASTPTPDTTTPGATTPSPSSTTKGAASTDTPSTSSAPTTNSNISDASPATEKAITTTVDFGSPSGSKNNPTLGSVPAGLAAIMAKSSFAVDNTKSCNQIDSAQLLSGASFVAPDKNHKALGGLAFVLNCAATGGEAKVTFTLGGIIADLSKVKIYKQNSLGVSRDITNQVNLSNKSTDGHTVVSYALKDGQSLDDDGTANGSISDPIYIVTPASVPTNAPVSIAAKNTPWLKTVSVVGAIIVIAVIVTAVIVRKRRSA
jgi:hypothetical protein